MNLRDLEYFKYLAESLSFTKTAEHFFVSQPSISIALKRLEEEFETVLIQRERSAKNIHLTSSGHILYQRTIDMLGLYGQTKQEVKAVNIENIQLGLVPSIGNHFLPKLLASANEHLHSLKLIEENTTDDLFESLKSKKYSTAILAHHELAIKNNWLDTYLLDQSSLKLCVSKKHPLASFRELSILELINEPFVSLGKGSIHEKLFNEWAVREKLPLDNVFYCHDTNTLISLVLSGARIALLMDAISFNHQDELVAIPIKNAPICYTSLVVNNTMELSNAQIAFNQSLINSIQP